MYVDVFAAVAELKKGWVLKLISLVFLCDGTTEPSTDQMLNRDSEEKEK